MPVNQKCESGKVMRKVEGFGSWAKSKKDAGKTSPSRDAGMAPQREEGQPGWFPALAESTHQSSSSFSDLGKRSFHVGSIDQGQAISFEIVTPLRAFFQDGQKGVVRG